MRRGAGERDDAGGAGGSGIWVDLGYEALLDATQVNETTLAALAEGCNGDIRLILGQLQMIRLRARSLAYDDVKVGVRD